MDNALPFTEEPFTAQPLLVALIEKAFAKLHGNYAQLWSGFIDEGIEDITGYPCDKIPISAQFYQHLPPQAIYGLARLEKSDVDTERCGDMRYIHVEGRNLHLGDGLINTGILRNYLYPVLKAENGEITCRNPYADGGWMGKSGKTFTFYFSLI